MSHPAARRQIGVVHPEQLTLFTLPEHSAIPASAVAAAGSAASQSGMPDLTGARS